MHDVVIIGSGPAGISAAIYAARAGLKTQIISENRGALTKAEKIENYYGFANPISGEELLQNGVLQAQRLGAQIISGQVVNLGYDGDFIINTKDKAYKARSVVIATGSNRTAPKIKGFSGFEGKGISYCAVCDAFFYRGKDVAVLGCCEYALHEMMELLPIAGSVTLITNGAAPIPDIPEGNNGDHERDCGHGRRRISGKRAVCGRNRAFGCGRFCRHRCGRKQ